MRVGDVYRVEKNTGMFIQGPLARSLSKGELMWVTEVGKFWPTMERADGNYAFWGEFLTEFIEKGILVKVEKPPFTLAYAKDHHLALRLSSQLKEVKSRLKKYKS